MCIAGITLNYEHYYSTAELICGVRSVLRKHGHYFHKHYYYGLIFTIVTLNSGVKSVARRRLGKHDSATTNQEATIVELLTHC
jgi:hypothetical protein